MTMAPAFSSGARLRAGVSSFTVTVSVSGATVSCTSSGVVGPAAREMGSLLKGEKPSLVTVTV